MKKLLSDESGQALVEYGLIISLVAVALITAVSMLGNQLDFTYHDIARILNSI